MTRSSKADPVPITPEYWDEAKAHLRSVDPILGAVISRLENPPLRSKGRVFETLVHSIVGQQISAKAAAAVWGRFIDCVGDVVPEQVAAREPEVLRKAGLSGRKVEYILGLATTGAWVVDHPWSERTDDEVRSDLVSLRGVGPWTAEMVLIFTLLRPDILPLGDIGVVRSMEGLYAQGDRLQADRLRALAEPWRPYRTVATWYLWRHLDAEPVEY